ncbi:MAG: 2-polyprenylphenol 6-hydroxylase [Proteobacteria bacterium]|nr:2-polyprenylphenol 6-hydroxylase [Pseudomonadota bacterium]
MLRDLRNFARLWAIGRTLARHDALFLLNIHPAGAFVARICGLIWRPSKAVKAMRPGLRLAMALADLGPTFIKFGQALSTRADLLGDEVAADLSELQDRLSPFPFKDAKAAIETDFAKPITAIYQSFEETPVAAASIAQVHFAVTTEGEAVAVKVLRPGVKLAFVRDIDLMFWMAEKAERYAPKLRRLKPMGVVETFAESVNLEMDLRFEAAAAQELKEDFASSPIFYVPSIDWQRTSERILTMERVAGIRVDDRAAVTAAGVDPVRVVKNAAEIFFRMVFDHGFFHADMHPGNLFVTPQGTVIAMDFGIMGRVDSETQKTLGEMLLGFLTRDYKLVANVHIRAGFVPSEKDVDMFAQACRSIAEPILGKPIAEISIAKLLGQLFRVTETFNMQAQPQLLLLQKSMLLAEGVGRNLAPEVNMWELARPLIEGWMRARLGPEGRTMDAVADTINTLRTLPRVIARIEAITADMEQGGLRLHPDSARAILGGTAERRHGQRWLFWAPWVLTAILGAALILN